MRVLLVGLGPLGRAIAADLVALGRDELAGAVDVDPKLVGAPLRELVPGAAPKLVVEKDLARALRPARFDAALVTTVSELERAVPTFRTLLGDGLTVVSTCEELTWPALHRPELARELDLLARERGARLLGTGVNPGFLMDAFPLVASAATRGVRRVLVERVQDASKRRVPFQEKIGACRTLAEFQRLAAAGRLRHVGLAESLHMLAAGLGLALERTEETLEPVVAERELESALGHVPPGAAAGVRQTARGFVADELVLELVFQAALGQADPRDRIVIDGDPPLELVWRGGVHGDAATSAVVLAALPALQALPAGLHTMLSLVPLRGRAWRPRAPSGEE
jgi:4-hydroxy-tetrahydrodipicolinate reductase